MWESISALTAAQPITSRPPKAVAMAMVSSVPGDRPRPAPAAARGMIVMAAIPVKWSAAPAMPSSMAPPVRRSSRPFRRSTSKASAESAVDRTIEAAT